MGITLSYNLGSEIATEVTEDVAVAMPASGSGFASEQLSIDLIMELRGTRKNMTLPSDRQGLCRAAERCDHLTTPALLNITL